MKILYGSDLHLEFEKKVPSVPECDVLLLAGDIFIPMSSVNLGNSAGQRYLRRCKNFFRECSRKCSYVFLVLGNHEHYHGTLQTTLFSVEKFIDDLGVRNVYIMENDTSYIGGYFLFGATLWTDANNMNPLVSLDIQNKISDFSHIQTATGDLFTVEDAYNINLETRKMLKNFLDSESPCPKIVMTHHAPFFGSIHPNYRNTSNSNLNFGFANTGLEYLIDDDSNLKFWVHGHVHDAADYECMGIRVVANPHGYETREDFQFKELK